MLSKEKIERAARFISERRRVVALTGAGVSAESGISTYRDKGGLWDRYPEGDSGGIMAVISRHPEDAPEILLGFLDGIRASSPNPGHLALAELEEMGYLSSIITQNVDNLHRRAGNSRVLEMHGNLYRFRCLVCGKTKQLEAEEHYSMMSEAIKNIKQFTLEEVIFKLPLCACGGNIRPDVVGFGEPVLELKEALLESESCDLMLILGTSGVVYPAASMPARAKSKGALVIEINPNQSSLTGQADLFLEGMSGEILPRIVSSLKELN